MTVVEELERHIRRHGYLCLDGGLATALESKGHVLDDSLWSARILRDAPEEIVAVHREFLASGARCISSASYQAHEWGFVRAGISAQEGCRLIDVSIELAIQAREGFLRDSGCKDSVFVAASLGPFGAYLAEIGRAHV